MTKDIVARRSGTRADRASRSFPLRALVALSFGIVALLVSGPPAQAGQGGGTAKYKYVVTGGSEYTGSGQLNATRGLAACSPGLTSYRQGGVTSEPVELPPLVFGKGSLKIGHDGTSGEIAASIPNVFSFSAQHTLVVDCMNGVPSAAETTPCSEQLEAQAFVVAKIKGGTGRLVKIEWDVSIFPPVFPGPVPDFTCVEGFAFPPATEGCKSNAKLNQFTKKRLTLDFECHGTDEDGGVSPPDVYQADSDAFGRLALCRKARGGTDQVCATRKRLN